MDRRDFIKLSALTGIAAALPLNFLVDNRDGETKFVEYIVTTYNELQVVELLGIYCFTGWYQDKNGGFDFFRTFSKRQPNVDSWLQEKIGSFSVKGGKFTSNSALYNRSLHDMRYKEDQQNWAKDEYRVLAKRFNLPLEEQVLTKYHMFSSARTLKCSIV